MRKQSVRLALIGLLVAGLGTVANSDTSYEPYFQSINRCVGGYLVQSGMSRLCVCGL